MAIAVAVTVLASVAMPATAHLPGSASESLRAEYHLTPPVDWLSDPQRPVHLNGIDHFYYLHSDQNNGFGGWRHTTTTDGVVFADHGMAIPKGPNFPVWTGSGVVDTSNTAGFGAGAVVVLATRPTNGDPYQQEQYLFYSTDGGHTFISYGSPVILNPGNDNWFRDPKIHWDATRNEWIAVIGRAQRAAFYTSPDLKNWTFESELTYASPNIGGFECPDLFQMKADDGTWHWVLAASMQGDLSNLPDTYAYWTGDWNGTSFIRDTTDPQWLDWGWDWYAAVTWPNQSAPDTSRYAIGWMNNWHYAPRAIPTDESDNYNGQMSITRELSLVKQPNGSYALLSQPTAALDTLVTRTVTLPNQTVTGQLDLPYQGVAYRLDVDLSWSSATNVGISVGQSADKLRGTNIGIFGNRLYVDRSRSDQASNLSFGSTRLKSESPAFATALTSVHLTILVDRTSVEVFADGGRVAHSNSVHFLPGDAGITLYTDGGSATFTNMTIREFRDVTNAAAPATPYADFESTGYGAWTTTGSAFGTGPAAGTLPGQQPVTGYQGSRLVNSFLGGDASTGTLRSPNFTISKPFINLLVGGGRHPRPGELFADFEGTTFGPGWTAKGDFAGQGPNATSFPGQIGAKTLDTFVGGGDPATGAVVSPQFEISRDYITFKIAGGNHPWGTSGATAINLVVDGVVHRTATGNNSDTMVPVAWDVRDLNGRDAHIEVVDNNAGHSWGHFMIDQLQFTDDSASSVGQPVNPTSVNLVVGGQVVRTTTGQDSEHLRWASWNVRGLIGQTAYLEIVDDNTGSWGHINADHITFDDRPAT